MAGFAKSLCVVCFLIAAVGGLDAAYRVAVVDWSAIGEESWDGVFVGIASLLIGAEMAVVAILVTVGAVAWCAAELVEAQRWDRDQAQRWQQWQQAQAQPVERPYGSSTR